MELLVDYDSLERIFTPLKVQADTMKYWGLNPEEIFIVKTYDKYTGSVKNSTFSTSDPIFIATIQTNNKFGSDNTCQYIIEVFVGNYNLHTTGMVDFDKFRMILVYAEDLQLKEVVCYHSIFP